MMINRQEFELVNSLPDAITIWFEPWAESMQLESGGVVQLVYLPKKENLLCIEYETNAITVYGIPESSLTAFLNGEQVWQSYSSS